MHDLHVIQGPNVARDARERIAFFPFHAFVVEDSRFQQNRVRGKLYNCGACVCKNNVEIRIAGSFCVWYLDPDRVTLILCMCSTVSEAIMSRQTTLGRFGFEKSISQRNSVMETKVLDFFQLRQGQVSVIT